MVRFVEALLGISVMVGIVVVPPLRAADSASANFSAHISDGSCGIQLSQDTLEYGFYRAIDFQPSSAVAILPLTASVSCSGATTPTFIVTGTTPYVTDTVFRDADSVATGVGFMVRRDTGGINLGNFYDEAAAISNNTPIALTPITVAETAQNEPLLFGLVRARNAVITSGVIKATLTLTVSFD